MKCFTKTSVLLGCILITNSVCAQYLQRSTLAYSGSANQITTSGQTYLVSQSIGQSSVIGTFIGSAYSIGQGFQQSPSHIVAIESLTNDLDATVYPNPVNTEINVVLNEEVESSINISIYDFTGQMVYNNTEDPSDTFQVNMALFTPGTYLLKLTTKKKKFIVRLVKY